jgi:hypothetical protein
MFPKKERFLENRSFFVLGEWYLLLYQGEFNAFHNPRSTRFHPIWI